MNTGNYLFSVKIYSPTAKGRITIFTADNGQSTINLSANEQVQTISLSITNNAIKGFRLFNDSINKPIYYDEFIIKPL